MLSWWRWREPHTLAWPTTSKMLPPPGFDEPERVQELLVAQTDPLLRSDSGSRLSDEQEVMCQSLVYLQGSGPGGPLLYGALLSLPFLLLARLRSASRTAHAKL